MNIPLEAPCDRLDQPREPGDVMADAAQRDLFEYFAPPLTETGAPPLAGDFSPAAAPDAVAAVEDEDVTCHNQTWHDQTWHDQILAWPDDIYDDEISHHEPESPDEIAAYDPGACATHPEVAALDEASKANLRRLETTLSWMQNEVEACRLPPATPLSPILGLPVVGRIIDRSTLDRTLHRAPPPPAWLREPPAEPGIAPPSRGRVFWPRAVKFAMACAIAAPLAYYFAVTTSPLHEPLVEIAGVASLVSPVVRPPEPRLRMSGATPELASEGSALAPERIIETPALPKPVQVETAIRSSPELPVAEAASIPAPAAPAQAAQTEASQAEAPRVEAARAQITGPPATAVAEDKASSAPPQAVRASVPATTTAGPQDVKLLIDQGKQFFDVGDLIAARILFLRAANAGDAAAAVAMGSTYDPVVLADRGVLGPAADLDKARGWYERAKEMGSPEGPRRLEMLANR
jgi:hypothetical protein